MISTASAQSESQQRHLWLWSLEPASQYLSPPIERPVHYIHQPHNTVEPPSEYELALLRYLDDWSPATTKEVAEGTGRDAHSITPVLRRMERHGYLAAEKRREGRLSFNLYAITAKGREAIPAPPKPEPANILKGQPPMGYTKPRVPIPTTPIEDLIYTGQRWLTEPQLKAESGPAEVVTPAVRRPAYRPPRRKDGAGRGTDPAGD